MDWPHRSRSPRTKASKVLSARGRSSLQHGTHYRTQWVEMGPNNQLLGLSLRNARVLDPLPAAREIPESEGLCRWATLKRCGVRYRALERIRLVHAAGSLVRERGSPRSLHRQVLGGPPAPPRPYVTMSPAHARANVMKFNVPQYSCPLGR